MPEPVRDCSTPESIAAFWQRVAGIDIERCTHCGLGTLRIVATLTPRPHPPP